MGDGGAGASGSAGAEAALVAENPAPDENYTETVDDVPLDLVFVEGGTYRRGCDDCAPDDEQYEEPEHDVTLGDFHIARYEVTQAQWRAVMGDDPPAFGASDNTPRIGVSWFDANEFLCELNSRTGRAYRLPTDAEWEFSARGGNLGKDHSFRYSGSNDPDAVAWHSGNSGGQAHEVGTKAANELGVFDMSGNAWEWVYDWLAGYTAGPKTDPIQVTGTGNKTRRGGDYSEPPEFARVSRRAIRSRDGSAGMGFRIAHSNALPHGMVGPCEAANPSAASCAGDENRDCRLVTSEDEVWEGDGNVLIARQGGLAAVSGYPATSGQWYTLNNRSLNVVSSSGAKKNFAYYVFSADELTMIGEDGMPYRLYRKPAAEVTGDIPSLPSISAPTPLAEMLAGVAPERMVSNEELANPDTSVRDPRLVPPSGSTWFMDGRCCGGNHKYRFHLEANGNAEFVVMDYDDAYKENVLARGNWFTVGNISLHIQFEGGYYNYLYTAGTRTSGYGDYMPAGPIYSHISFQDYERGDFRIFSSYPYDQNVTRPRGPAGDSPVYEPGPYRTASGDD